MRAAEPGTPDGNASDPAVAGSKGSGGQRKQEKDAVDRVYVVESNISAMSRTELTTRSLSGVDEESNGSSERVNEKTVEISGAAKA